jgi:hypothetical protein
MTVRSVLASAPSPRGYDRCHICFGQQSVRSRTEVGRSLGQRLSASTAAWTVG